MFDQSMLKAFGMDQVMKSSEQTMEAMKTASNTVSDAMNSVAARNMETSKQFMADCMAASRDLTSCTSADEFISKQAASAQSLAQQAMAAQQQAASDMSAAASKAADIMNKQFMSNMSAYSEQAKKMASSMASATKSASSK